MIGRPKAAVLPVPVWARPIMSRRSSTSGIAFTWIGVGVVNSMLSSVRNMPAERPRSENLVKVFSLSGTRNVEMAAAP